MQQLYLRPGAEHSITYGETHITGGVFVIFYTQAFFRCHLMCHLLETLSFEEGDGSFHRQFVDLVSYVERKRSKSYNYDTTIGQ